MIPDFLEVRIENTNACGYRCFMCPREKQTRKIGYMPIEDFELVLNKLPKKKLDLHLHGYGEPLLDRDLMKKIKHAKESGDYNTTIFSTLGVNLSNHDLKMLAESGLDQIVVSMYGFEPQGYKKIHGTDKFDLVQKNIQTLADYVEILNTSLKIVVKVVKPDKDAINELELKNIQEVLASYKRRSIIVHFQPPWHNYGNGRMFNPFSKKLCPVVKGERKKVLQVTWDLHVIPCCFDFNASIKFGNLRQQSLEEVFTSEAYKTFIENHLKNDLSQMLVCQGCEKRDVDS